MLDPLELPLLLFPCGNHQTTVRACEFLFALFIGCFVLYPTYKTDSQFFLSDLPWLADNLKIHPRCDKRQHLLCSYGWVMSHGMDAP